jgi:hypothetical protein
MLQQDMPFQELKKHYFQECCFWKDEMAWFERIVCATICHVIFHTLME